MAILDGDAENHELLRQLKEVFFEATRLGVEPDSLCKCFVGFDCAVYWTRPDLAIGNLLCFREIDYSYSFPHISSAENKELLNRTFYFPAQNAVLEIFHNSGAESKRILKESVYKKIVGLKYVSVDVAKFIKNSEFDVNGWIRYVNTALRSIEVDVRYIPENCACLLDEHLEIKLFLNMAIRYQLTNDHENYSYYPNKKTSLCGK